MPEDNPAEDVSKGLVGTGVAIASALFLAAGFLAARAYLGALGLPENISISVDGYIQYGARFFVVLISQLFPVVIFLVILLFPTAAIVRRMKRSYDKLHYPMMVCLVTIGSALAGIGLELHSLRLDPVFAPARVRDVPSSLRLGLYGIEIMVVITITLIAWAFPGLWRDFSRTFLQKGLLSAALLLAVTEILLLPLCFGQIAMIPSAFDRVTLVRDKGDPGFSGILIFSDASSYFVYSTEGAIVEIAHSAVKEVRHESRELLGKLATK